MNKFLVVMFLGATSCGSLFAGWEMEAALSHFPPGLQSRIREILISLPPKEQKATCSDMLIALKQHKLHLPPVQQEVLLVESSSGSFSDGAGASSSEDGSPKVGFLPS